MMRPRLQRPAAWALAALACIGAPAWANDPGPTRAKSTIAAGPIALPAPAEVRSIASTPTALDLQGPDDARQLVLTATLNDGRLQDLSGSAQYTVKNPAIARVSASGRVTPTGDGATAIVGRFGDRTVEIPVVASSGSGGRPVNFANQVVPVFTKLGCNSGGCHGKASGQNGFHLSLLGFEPEVDHDALVREGRGRRLFTPSPDHSLLLRKATGAIPHGGGRKMEPDSDEYKAVRRWIAAGAPFGSPNDPVVTRVSIFPERRIATRANAQQLAVTAHYSDGSAEDVTRRAQFECNDPDIAAVDAEGLVRTGDLSGEAAVMVRYQGHVAVFRATVPTGLPVPDYDFTPRTVVDRLTLKKWRELGLMPSAPCTDGQFVRRATLDVAGTLPTAEQVRAFVADTSPTKREALVDALLETPEYADFFAVKWADVLRVKRGSNQPTRAHGTFAFREWIRTAIADDLPYDAFARAILTAQGTESRSPTTVWYKDLATPELLVDDTAQVFLGMRMACAQCHHHPYEKWGQSDYWGLAAFFGRLGRRPDVVPGVFEPQNGRQGRQVIFTRGTGKVVDKRTGKPAAMKPPDGDPVEVAPGDDPRIALASWMTDPKNPFFARAVANRYWAHFLGRGIVDPLDDLRATNPPSNPELLDALADDLATHGYRLKHLIRTICTSATYGLSAEPNELNARDRQSYARYYPKRLPAEVVFDAVSQVIGAPATFPGLPTDSQAPRRAIALPDEAFASYFLDVFGRPQRITACECERVGEASMAQVLHLLNSDDVQSRLVRAGARAETLAKDPRPDAEKVEDLFLAALARPPSSPQLARALAHLGRDPKKAKTAYEDILWSLINTKEFVFNR